MLHSNIKIDFSFALVLAFFYIFGKLELFLTFFICAVLHEFAHLLMCIFLKEKVKGIRICSYGISLYTEFIKNPFSTIIIGISGPLLNLILYFLFKNSDFAYANLTIFLVNLIPILPLDGGVILKSIITLKGGYVNSYKFMIAFSQIFAYFIFLLGIFLIFITKYNISLLIIGVFLLYNIKSEKNSLICLKKKLLCNELYDKSFLNIKNIAVYTDTKLIECMEYFSYNTLLNVVVFSYNNKKLSEFSQYEIIDLLTKNSTLINFTDAINMKGYTNELKE